jgi:uncharacterized repeat protein (TIGR01451 family)
MRRLVVLILGLTVMHAGPARAAEPSPRCIALGNEPAQIEVLPFKVRGNTCGSLLDGVSAYGEPCAIRGVLYDGHDVVYEVFLHEGNRVEFVLNVLDEHDGVAEPGDLTLALLKECDDGRSCNGSSEDGFGSEDETLPAASYPPKVYYLVVDSANGARCGPYELSVKGKNPTPDLKLEVDLPAKVFAGKDLTYKLVVRNAGSLAELPASGVTLTLELPRSGVRRLETLPEGCSKVDEKVVCHIPDLAPGEGATRQITVNVEPSFRGALVAPRAEAQAAEADATPADSKVSDIGTTVKGKSDLSVVVQPVEQAGVQVESVVAGAGPLTYTLRVHNAGPSDALAPQVKAELVGQAELLTPAPADCSLGNPVTCTVAKIKVGETVVLEFHAKVPSSASGELGFGASVAVAVGEEDPNGDNNSAPELTTRVVRVTDLKIVKSGPGTVIGCSNARYDITVHNLGPSDSTGATVTDRLEPGVKLVGPDICASEDGENGTTVTCTIDEVRSREGKLLPITVHVHPSSTDTPVLPLSISDLATVKADEPDDDPDNNTSPIVGTLSTTVTGADLRLAGLSVRRVSELPSTAATTSVIAGENLLYTIEVANGGPRPRDATVTVYLDLNVNPGKGAELVGSTGLCSQPGPPSSVICSVPALGSGVAQTVEFVARLAADASSGSLFTSTARVDPVGADDDTCVENDESDVVALRVERQADLSVSLTDAPDPVAEGKTLIYTVSVTNAGPSDASDVKAQLVLLPEAVSLVQEGCKCSGGVDALLCFGDLAAGSPKSCTITVEAPESGTRTLATAKVSSSTPDPDPMDNESQTTTTLAKDGQADLTVSKTAAAAAVVVGDLVEYTIVVTNNGPAEAGWRVEDHLCDGLTYVSLPDVCKADSADGRLITCASQAPLAPPLAPLASFAIPLQVRVEPTFAGGCDFDSCAPPSPGTVDNEATVSTKDGVVDPDPNNNQSCSSTTLLTSRSLVLPFFEAETSPAGPTTLFAVSNPTDFNVGVRYDYVFATGTPASAKVCLDPHETCTRNLRDVLLALGLTAGQGHVVVEPDTSACALAPAVANDCALAPPVVQAPPVVPAPAVVPAPELGGDFFRLDRLPSPAHDRAGGELLVSADTSRLPPELCELWDTRFLNDAARGLSTEFVFYVPRAGNAEVVAVGQVYTEDGKLLQKVEVRAPIVDGQRQLAFRQGGAALLTKFGAVEWELRDEIGNPIAGNVSVVHRAAGRYVVALPGVCRRPPAGKDGSEPPLVLPYFEVDEAEGVTTLLAVRNGTDQEVNVQFEYFSAQGEHIPTVDDNVLLGPHATHTRNLRDIIRVQDGSALTGWVWLTLIGPPPPGRAERVLSGDFVRIDRAGAAGGALVDSDPRRIPAQLCSRWDVRFVNDGRFAGRTRFLFYVAPPAGSTVPPLTGSTVQGKVYLEDGSEGPVVPPFNTLDVVFARGSGELSGHGTIEWALSAPGYVAAILEAAGSSVLVPGICRDQDPGLSHSAPPRARTRSLP